MAISVNITADTSEFSRAISKAAHDTQKFDRLNNAAAKTFQELSSVTDKQANTYRSLVNKIQDVESSTSSLSSKQTQLRATGEKLRKLYSELRDKETTEANTLKKLIKQVDKQADSYRKLAKAKENTTKASKGLGNQMMIMSAQFLSVKAALDTLKGALTANEGAFDDFNRLVEQGTSLWNNFLSAVGRGSSFTDWAKNLSNVTEQAAKLYDTLDALGSMKQLNSASIAAIELEIKKLEEEAKLGKSIDKDRLDALKERKRLLKEEMQLQEEAAAKQKIISALSEKGMTSGEATFYANYIIDKAKKGENINTFFSNVRSNANARVQQLGYKVGNSNELATDIKQVLEHKITDPFVKSSRKLIEAEAGVAEGLKYLENSLKDRASDITSNIKVNRWSGKAKDKKIVLDSEDNIEEEYDERWTEYFNNQNEELAKEWKERETELKQHNLNIIVSETEFNDAIQERIKELNESLENKTEGIVSSASSINSSLSSFYETLQGLGEIENPFQFFDALFGVAQEIISINEALKQLGEISKMTAEAQALASQKNALASSNEATADTIAASGKTFKAHADIPFVGIAIATAMVGTMIAAMLSYKSKAKSATKFANGGIVGGSSFIGDMNIARVNSGEMILNGSQQKKLFSMLNENSNVGNPLSSNVTFVIKGQDLVGTLNNYNRKLGRVR